MGPETLWLSFHHFLSIALVLALVEFVGAGLFFTKEPSARVTLHMKVATAGAFLIAVLVTITGIVPDTKFGDLSVFNTTTVTGYGTTALHVTNASLGNFAGPIMFDMMEHVALVVPGLIAMIAVLCWAYGSALLRLRDVKASVISLVFVTFTWIAVISIMGIIMVKYLTFPVKS